MPEIVPRESTTTKWISSNLEFLASAYAEVPGLEETLFQLTDDVGVNCIVCVSNQSDLAVYEVDP